MKVGILPRIQLQWFSSSGEFKRICVGVVLFAFLGQSFQQNVVGDHPAQHGSRDNT